MKIKQGKYYIKSTFDSCIYIFVQMHTGKKFKTIDNLLF